MAKNSDLLSSPVRLADAAPARLRVLLVDDVEENTLLLADVLAEHGFETVEARNGKEALDLLARETFHLVVADAMMPVMDGFVLCKELRSSPALSSILYIMYTGNFVGDEDREFARSIGVDRYVMKQGGVEPLVAAVRDLMSERHLVQPASHPASHPAPHPRSGLIDDRQFLEQHNEVLIRKLQEQMQGLERQAASLREKNLELSRSEARYRRLFDKASVGIMVLDRELFRVVDINARGLSILGLSREDLLSAECLSFLDPPVQEQMRLAHTFIAGETSIRTASHDHVDIEIGFGPMTEPDDTRMLVFMRDITEEKRLRDQLVQFEKMSLMGRLAAGIAHEIRNPLSSLTLNVQYLVGRLAQETELFQCAQDALEGAQRVDAVIENTLSLARMGPVNMVLVNLQELVRQSLAYFKVPLRLKRLTLETEHEAGPLYCQADPRLLQQVVLNVVQNAIDASAEGGKIKVTTGIEHPHGSGSVAWGVVGIRDFGQGITADQRRHLFEEFYTTKVGGTGLGLALSRQIMERHNGSIDIQSAPREGALVRLLIPVSMMNEGHPDDEGTHSSHR